MLEPGTLAGFFMPGIMVLAKKLAGIARSNNDGSEPVGAGDARELSGTKPQTT